MVTPWYQAVDADERDDQVTETQSQHHAPEHSFLRLDVWYSRVEIPYFLNVSHTSLPPCLPFYGSATGTGVEMPKSSPDRDATSRGRLLANHDVQRVDQYIHTAVNIIVLAWLLRKVSEIVRVVTMMSAVSTYCGGIDCKPVLIPFRTSCTNNCDSNSPFSSDILFSRLNTNQPMNTA